MNPVSLRPAMPTSLFQSSTTSPLAAGAVLDALPGALCVVAEDGCIELGNLSFARLFATRPESLTGLRLTDLIEPPRWQQAREHPGSPSGTALCTSLDGRNFVAALVVRPLPDRRHLLALQPAASDEPQLEGLATLAGGVAHEFNNLLTTVLGYAQLLPERTGDAAGLTAAAGQIIAAARRGAEVVHQLQLFARAGECRRSRQDVHQLIRDSIAHTSRGWPETVLVEFRPHDGPVPVLLNAPQIILALQHILQNARQAMPAGAGRIAITTIAHAELSPPMLRVTIEDDGVGMDEATRRRVLQPFFSNGSRGLGLTVAYGVLKAHGGTIEVDAAPVGGTRIHLWLPLAAEDGRAPADHALSEDERELIESIRGASI